jgi:hypothetical protein
MLSAAKKMLFIPLTVLWAIKPMCAKIHDSIVPT